MKQTPHYVKSGVRRVVFFVAIFAVTVLFALYYFGFYDISFIKRPASWNEHLSDWEEKLRGDETSDVPPTEPSQTDPPETTKPGTEPLQTEPSHQTEPPVVEPIEYPSVPEMQAAGYRITDAVYDAGTMTVARLPLTVGVPTALTLRKMRTELLTSYYASENDEYYNIKSWYYKEVYRNRPAVMPYMGYILVDTGGDIQLLDSAGYQIGVYDPKTLDLAYVRDKAGRPLFSRDVTRTVEIPASETVGEDGEPVFSPARTLTVQEKEYFYFDEGKGQFVRSDYNELTDSRGLRFDYPAYYGIDDAGKQRRVRITEHVRTLLDGSDVHFYETLWKYNKLNDNVFKFSRAYGYSEGRAVTEYTYDLTYTTGGGKEYNYTITASLILNEKGRTLFTPYRTMRYQSWYQIEWYKFPDYDTEEAVGFYYYDHGLIRARRQIVDFSSWVYNNMKLKVLFDEEVLLDRNGKIVPVPAGMTVEGYSNGMILMKNEEGRYCYYNYEMLCVTDPVYTGAEPFSEGLGVCRNEAGLWGVIDTDGNVVVPFAYTSISRPSSGVLVLYDGAEWTVLQKMTK